MPTLNRFAAWPRWVLSGLMIGLLAACGPSAAERAGISAARPVTATNPAALTPTLRPDASPTAIPSRTPLPTRGVWPVYATWTPSPNAGASWTPSPAPVRLSRSCLADLPPTINSLDALDQPDGLIVERWQTGMWISPPDLWVLQITSAGVARQISFAFQRDQPATPIPWPFILRPGRYDIHTCETWTVPVSLTQGLQDALDDPAFVALTTETANPASQGCPDDPGLALVTRQRPRQQPLNVWCTPSTGGSPELLAVEAFFWEIYDYEYARPR